MRPQISFLSIVAGLCCANVAAAMDLPEAKAVSGAGCIYASPHGNGPSLEEMGLAITVTIMDSTGDPIAGFPWQDIWVASFDYIEPIAPCRGGTTAERNTDSQGETTISRALSAGGYDDGLQVHLVGVPIIGPPLDIRVVSADLNGDRVVDMLDVVHFAARFSQSTTDWTLDLSCDGNVNLLDAVRLSGAIGERCP